MSVKAMAWVWDQPINRDEKFVLLAYADHADHNGYNIFPAVASVAKKTGYSERSIQRITHKLIESGWLIEDGTSNYQTNKYHIPIYGGDNLSPPTCGGIKQEENKGDKLAGGDKNDMKLVADVTGGVTKTTEGGDIAMSPEPSLTINKPSVKPGINHAPNQPEQIRQIINHMWANNDQIKEIDDLISINGFEKVKEIAEWVAGKETRTLSHAISSMVSASKNWKNNGKSPKKESTMEMLDRQLEELGGLDYGK